LDVPGIAWQTVYGYFNRWSQTELWREVLALSQAEQGLEADDKCAVDSTCIKVHKDGANPAGGQENQALGRTKGGLNSKLHAAVDGYGRPLALSLTAGQVSDCPQAIDLLERAGGWKIAIMDRAYDSDAIREYVAERKGEACIPAKSSRIDPVEHNKETYKTRHVVENFFEKLKRSRRIGTRYDKLDRTFFSFIIIWISTLYMRNQF
jgi:transposase